MTPPNNPKIYHIVHVDRLASIAADGCLRCDAQMAHQARPGTAIGMDSIKRRRLTNRLASHDGLRVGDCVPFYFCPRSIMLYVIHKANHRELAYRGGQEPIVHLEADLRETVAWAARNGRRWAFTLSNAGSGYFQDYCDLTRLGEIDWNAVEAQDCKEEKQAEFLLERSFPWMLVRRIGVYSRQGRGRAHEAIRQADHKPDIEVEKDWYY